MARPSKFDEEQILDATLELVAGGGPGAATVAAIADALGAPVGSLYHRFRSRDLVLAHLWLRTVRRFQVGFLAALASDNLDEAAVGAARHSVDWARQHLDEARLLSLYHRQDLAGRWPEELGEELAGLNDDVEAAMRDHARRRYGDDDEEALRQLTFALVDLPYAAVRRSLRSGTPPPPGIDDLVAATCRFILIGHQRGPSQEDEDLHRRR